MNIYTHELKTNLRSAIVWAVSLILLLLTFMSIFSSFANDAAILQQAMDQMPKELLIAFGMNDMDLSTVLGYFSFIFLFCQICLAIQAANYGFALVSVEETEMTADFLLAKPVARPTILTHKLLAAVTNLAITNVAVWISSFACIEMFRNGRSYEQQTLILLLLSMALFQLFFLGVGCVLSLLMKRVRSVTSLSMALAFGMYVLSAFGGMLGEDGLDLLTPFKHFEARYIITHAAYNLPLVGLNVAVMVLSIVGSYVLYTRRNIYTAV